MAAMEPGRQQMLLFLPSAQLQHEGREGDMAAEGGVGGGGEEAGGGREGGGRERVLAVLQGREIHGAPENPSVQFPFQFQSRFPSPPAHKELQKLDGGALTLDLMHAWEGKAAMDRDDRGWGGGGGGRGREGGGTGGWGPMGVLGSPRNAGRVTAGGGRGREECAQQQLQRLPSGSDEEEEEGVGEGEVREAEGDEDSLSLGGEEGSSRKRKGGPGGGRGRGCGSASGSGSGSLPHAMSHLMTERRRRERLNEQFLALRGVVPNITKMNKLSTLEDAIHYIKTLQQKVSLLEKRLKAFESGGGEGAPPSERESQPGGSLSLSHSSSPSGIEPLRQVASRQSPLGRLQDLHSASEPLENSCVDVEVKLVDEEQYLVNFHCRKRRGLLLDVGAAMEAAALEVKQATVMASAHSTHIGILTGKIGEERRGREAALQMGLKELLSVQRRALVTYVTNVCGENSFRQ